MTEYSGVLWSAVGFEDLRIVRFLAVCEADRICVVQVRTEMDLNFVAVVPLRQLVKRSPAGRLLPWTVDEVADLACCHLDADRICIEK